MANNSQNYIPTIDMEATGKRIAKLAKEHGYSHNDLSDKCDIVLQGVYKWTSGKSLPSIDRMLVLSKLFGTGIDGILVLEGEDADQDEYNPMNRLAS